MDALIRVYNQMVDHLREERLRLAEQHHFLDQILHASPSGIVILDFDGRVDSLNPAAERLLDRRLPAPSGRRLDELASPLAAALVALEPGEAPVVAPARRAAREVPARDVPRSRVSPAASS